MCGIAGLVGGFVPGLMARMNAAQAHRGPDGQGVFEDSAAEAGLAHVRLAILDTSDLAAQPMYGASGSVLAYNGEIYNFKELRRELEGAGEHFSSTGDTEVLLRGLERWGEPFIERLNGIFAFALWDRRRRELLLARDPLGVKPLYLAEPKPDAVLFASEMKALFAYPGLRREADLDALQQHLAYSYASGDRTSLRGIRRLEPGHLLRWSAATRNWQTRRYWRPSFGTWTGSHDDATEALRGALTLASQRQLVSDVPVGAFLSGGLDSTIVTTLAAPAARRGFRCYTIKYAADDNKLDRVANDAWYARRVADRLRLELAQIELKPDMASLWPRLLWHMDEPSAEIGRAHV